MHLRNVVHIKHTRQCKPGLAKSVTPIWRVCVVRIAEESEPNRTLWPWVWPAEVGDGLAQALHCHVQGQSKEHKVVEHRKPLDTDRLAISHQPGAERNSEYICMVAL